MEEKQNSKDQKPEYWDQYNNLQRVKHNMIEYYLNAWFPILSSGYDRVVYFDTHAGRGKHFSGKYGSPLVALNTLIKHKLYKRLINQCEFVFTFIELDKYNLECLKKEIADLGRLSPKIIIDPLCGDCFKILKEIIEDLKSSDNQLAPSFVFVDPYGFKIPFSVLKELMDFQGVELFINIMWRWLGMGIKQGIENLNDNKEGFVESLNYIFGSDIWRNIDISSNFDEQAIQTAIMIKDIIGAKWGTFIRMLGDNQTTKYLLLHLTNHDKGRDVMKDCLWSIFPDGGFYVRQSENPLQEYLIEPEPDFSRLEKWIIEKLKKDPVYWTELIDALRPTIWKQSHLNKLLKQLKKENKIRSANEAMCFTMKANPLIQLK